MATYTVENEDGEEYQIELPTRFEVCPRCEGHGKHLHPAIGEHAYSVEEFNEAFDDDDERAAYFTRGGRYDVTCEQCHGDRVVEVIDAEHCTTDEQKEGLRLLEEKEHEDYAYEAMCRAERAMGA